MNDFLGKMLIFTIKGAGGSDHEEREAAEGFTELVPRLETTWNVDVVKANWKKNYVVWLLSLPHFLFRIFEVTEGVMIRSFCTFCIL